MLPHITHKKWGSTVCSGGGYLQHSVQGTNERLGGGDASFDARSGNAANFTQGTNMCLQYYNCYSGRGGLA